MSNNSIIEHRGSYYFVALREEYLTICLRSSYKKQAKEGYKSRASAHCKAFILDILEHWTNTKRGRGEDLAVFMTYQQWSDSMYSMFGRTTIIDSLDELIGDGLISKEPYKMLGNKDTYQYRLNFQELNKRIRQLPERNPYDTHPKWDASQMKPDASQKGRVTHPKRDGHPSQMKHNIDTNIDPNNIDSTERENSTGQKDSHITTSKESSPSPQKNQSSPPEKKTLSPEVIAILDCWDEIRGSKVPRSDKQKKAAKELAEVDATKEQIKDVEQFCLRDNPEWYSVHGIDLQSISNNWSKWQTAQEHKGKTVKPSSRTTTRVVSSYDDDNYIDDSFYPTKKVEAVHGTR